MQALMLTALVFAGAQPAASTEGGWVKLEADELRAVYGVRWVQKLSEPEVLDIHPTQLIPPLISTDGAVIWVGDASGALHARWTSSGRQLWKKSSLGQLGRGLGQVGDTLLAGGKGILYGLEGYSGKELWNLDLAGVIGGPIVTTGTIAIIPLRPNNFVAVDGQSGKVVWRVKRPKPEAITVRGQPQARIDRARGRAYLGTADGFLIAVSLETGETLWATKIAAPAFDEAFADVDTEALLLDGGKVVLAASYNGGLAALAFDTGQVLWKNDQLLHVIHLEQVPNARFIVACLGDGQVAGLDPSDGKVRWRYKLDGGVPTRAVALEAGLVAVGSSKGPLAILETLSGRPVQLVTPGSGMNAEPFARGRDLAVWTNKGHLLALRFGEGPGIAR